jgi:hypothetical protein
MKTNNLFTGWLGKIEKSRKISTNIFFLQVVSNLLL